MRGLDQRHLNPNAVYCIHTITSFQFGGFTIARVRFEVKVDRSIAQLESGDIVKKTMAELEAMERE